MSDPIFESDSPIRARTRPAPLAALALCLAALAARAQDLPTVAILPFAGDGISTEDLVDVADRFDSELRSTQAVKLTSHREVDRVLHERNLRTCQDGKCAVEAGVGLGVQQVYAGRISRFGKTWTLSVKRYDVEGGRETFAHVLDVRGGLDDLLDRGCQEMAEISVGQKKTASDHTVLVAPSGPLWPWIAGGVGIVAIAGGVTAAVLLLSDGSSSSTPSTRNVSIAWNPNP